MYRTAISIALKLTHGYDVQEGDDPVVHTADLSTENFSKGTVPGAFLVDIFPLLRYVPSWVPGAGFHKTAQAWGQVLQDMVEKPFDLAKKRMVRFKCSDVCGFLFIFS